MARLRKFCAYRRLERPYTRISKYRENSYIRMTPQTKIVRFNIGEQEKFFDHMLSLVSKDDCNIRDNAIESARQVSNKLLEKKIGTANYNFMIRVYPHHVLRENPLAAGAGADRMSTGMAHSFGKPIGIAARVKKGKTIITVRTEKAHIDFAKAALKRAASKLPCACRIIVEEIKKKE
jgi:large subunit ribosomal protein L10e